MTGVELPASVKAFAAREFAGEKLLWAARPDVRWAMLASCGIWVFAVPWTAFALFWESFPASALYEHYTGENIGAPKGGPIAMMWVFALFGLPFVAIGVGMLLAPFWVWLKGRRTIYVVTDRRIAVLTAGRCVGVESILPSEIAGLSRKEGPDGRGTLTVSRGYERDSEGDRVEKTTQLGVVADVRRVEGLVRGLQAKGTA